MRRSPRVIAAWIAAVVVALVTARVVATDLASLHARARSLGPTERVVLAARDLPVGTTIASGDLRVVRRPATTVATDAVHDPAQAVGRVVAVSLLRDDVVRTRHLAGADNTAGIDGIVRAGQRVLHVAAKDGYQPPPGAVVDILATFDPATVTVAGALDAHVVARGARILAVDGSTESGSASPPGVTLLVTEADARSVAFAATLGQVTFALAPPETACCTTSTP